MFEAELDIAKKAAIAAAEYLEGLSRFDVHSQEGRDIKLRADQESEEILMGALAPTGIPMLAEEAGAFGGQSGLRWIIDPLDGTYNFFRGLRELACVSVALWDGMRPLLGVVCRLGMPQLIEGNAVSGQAHSNGRPIRSSAVVEPSQAAFATGFPVYMDYEEGNLYQYARLAKHFKKIRMLGSAALMTSFVGTGQVDVYSEQSIKMWDIAAGVAIGLAAGGAMQLAAMTDADTCHPLLCANESLLEAAAPIVFGQPTEEAVDDVRL